MAVDRPINMTARVLDPTYVGYPMGLPGVLKNLFVISGLRSHYNCNAPNVSCTL